MSNYYAWGRRKGDKEWEKVAMIDTGKNGYRVVFQNDAGYWEKDVEIKGPIETPEKTLNLHQMLDDIRLLVENDFCYDMDLKTMPNSKEYTQEEARQMAWIIGRVYSIAHCTTCEACQRKYLK